MKLFEIDETSQMQELICKLNKAADAYYNGTEIMSNYEYDALLEKLQQLEEKTGKVLPGSPTNKVGAPVKVDKLEKVTHEFPALSLDKTKDVDLLVSKFKLFGDERDDVVVMWKLDGATVQLTYDEGQLVLAATRGDGFIGQNITHNAPYIDGIPQSIPYKSKLVVRGEATMSYTEFERINANLPDDKQYKNPRNLAAATITMLDPNDAIGRLITFSAFELVYMDNPPQDFEERLIFCKEQGLNVVEYHRCCNCDDLDTYSIRSVISKMTNRVKEYDIPVDGLVVAHCATNYTDDLQGTEHHPHVLKGYALKWEDETAITTLREVEWSPSRTGLLNPVAVFDSVELEGTTVSRASLHNFSIMRNLKINLGNRIKVCKANKIIPMVVENLDYDEEDDYDTFEVLSELDCFCPTCGSTGLIRTSKDGIETVYCENMECPAKVVYKLEHFCERTSMNIEGLSESTIKKFVDLGFMYRFSDIYTLDKYEDRIKSMPGFGEQSWNNLWAAIQKSRDTTFVRFVSAVGIPNIGVSQAKALNKYFKGNINEFLNSKYLDFSVVDGIGQIVSENILRWLHNSEIQAEILDVITFLKFKKEQTSSNNVFSCISFVITGSLTKFKNRKELEASIEANGGKVSSSVSKNTSYLINNDTNSTSSKNKKAKELNIPIISEEEYIKMLA